MVRNVRGNRGSKRWLLTSYQIEAVSHVLIYSRGDVQTLALTGQVGQAFPQGTGEDEKRILGVVITLPVSVQ